MEFSYSQLSRYIQPMIIIFGTIGALFNEVLFYVRKPLRSTSCTTYFRALSANDLLVIWFVIFPQWLDEQFHINPMTQYEWYCKLSSYLTFIFYTLSPYFIVLVCFDRLCTSSTNARLRKLATKRVASILIPIVIIFQFIAYSSVPIFCKLIPTSSTSICGVVDPVYSRFLALCLIILFSINPPLLMIIFCIITLILLRQQRRRIMPVNQARVRHRDSQLLKMLFIYVITNIVCTVPFTVTYLIVQNNSSSVNPWLISISILLVDATYATSFYMYTLSTPFHRSELYNLLKSIRQRIYREHITMIDLQPRRIQNENIDC